MQVIEWRDGCEVVAQIRAETREGAERAVEEYLRRYAPEGYDTRVVHRRTLTDGRTVVVIRRLASCD